MTRVLNIKGSLATNEMTELIRYLYSNIETVKSPTIKIKGDSDVIHEFTEYLNSNGLYF